MAELLLAWLNEEVRLSTPVVEFESTFASGYLLGEILHKANQQHNFADFVASDSADAKIVNFCLLEPTMRALGIRMDPVIATDVMNEASGAATKLLYQLKMAIARARRSGTVSCRPYEPGGVLAIHNVPGRLPKSVFDPIKHESFEHAIRLHLPLPTFLTRCRRKKAAAVQLAKDMAAQKAAYHENLEATRQQRLHLTKIQREFTQITTEGETEAWALATAKRHERERRKARYERLVAAKAATRQATATATAEREVTAGIATFEATHRSKAQEKKTKGLQLPQQLSIGYGVRSLRTVFKAQDVVVPAAPTAPPVVAAKRLERELRCDIQKKRRARFLKACDASQRERNDDVVQAALESTLLRATGTEVALAAAEANVVAYMDVVAANRAHRDAQYAARLATDEAEANSRDGAVYGMLHHRFTDAVQAQSERADRLEAAMAAALTESHVEVAHHVLNRVVDLAMTAAAYRSTASWVLPSTVFVPDETWTELLAFGVLAPDDAFTAGFDSPAAEALLNRFQLERHLSATRDASPEDVEPVAADVPAPTFVYAKLPREFALGEVVAYCKSLTSPAPPLPSRIPLPQFPLKLALVGKPFAGRKTCAKALCDKYGLALLSVHALLEAALAAQSPIGASAAALLVAGAAVPNAIYVDLLRDAIQSVDPNSYRGWVLVDFLASVDEARDVEKMLTGSVPEPPQPAVVALAPRLPTPPVPASAFAGTSGLDLVFRLDVDRTRLYRHCLGKLIDPVSGDRYHMQDAPPTEADPRHRVVPWRDPVVANETLSLLAHAHDVAAPALTAWFAPYGTLRVVSGDDMAGTIADHIDAFLAAAVTAATARSIQRELDANVAMAAEEARQATVAALDADIAAALEAEASAQQALKAGEDAKLKKDELLALRNALEAAHTATVDAQGAALQFVVRDRPGGNTTLPEQPSVVPAAALAAVGADVWAASEAQYERTMAHGFALLRAFRSRVEAHAVAVLSQFAAFVRRPDAKQALVDAFQWDVNANVLDDMRFDDSTKAELHVRVDALQDALLSVLDAKAAEAAAYLEGLLKDQWKEDAVASIGLLGTMLFQAEVDVFHAAVSVVADVVAGYEVGFVRVADDNKPPTLPLGKDPAEDEKEVPAVPVKGAAAKKKPVVEVEVVPLTPLQELTAAAQRAKDACTGIAGRVLKLPSLPGTATPSSAAPGKKDKDPSGQATPVPKKDTVASANAVGAVGYEYDYVTARLGAVQSRVADTIGYVELVLATLEADLRTFVATRLAHEREAVLTLVRYVRDAIEREENLPHRLLLDPAVVERRMPLAQAEADTYVRLQLGVRVLARPGPPVYPHIEHWDTVYLNTRQLNGVAAMLREVATTTLGKSDAVPRPAFTDGFARLAGRPTAVLPDAWLPGLAKLAAYFDKKGTGVIRAFPDVPRAFQAKHCVDDVVRALTM
ncbi:flagellar protein [Achlya hypogyna]|uniref:Flagellar protein n=1 Tax=Achlya hypogyna TaxID=1202772 RepID=A0A1V9Z387_ACHHY|nr:flagellar protein [Achlya hypogyna]